jgi:hypothetical protein
MLNAALAVLSSSMLDAALAVLSSSMLDAAWRSEQHCVARVHLNCAQ